MISVVIPTLIKSNKHLGLTVRCIERAVGLTGLDFETIIVETETNHLEDYADVYIHEAVKTTATKSINRGFQAASGEYIVLLTNDVLVDDRWLECLLECFQKREDCGIATLATTQFNHEKEDKIQEGVWFSLAMFTKQDKYFDEEYVNSWDDTDFIMRQYIQGKKSYRNYNCVVVHEPGQTHYESPDHKKNFDRNKELFISRYNQYEDMPIYKLLTEGWVF